MIYDAAIIGAGAAGLFAGAALAVEAKKMDRPAPEVIILEKGAKPGRKLLMAGSGQCNLTHAGSLRDFLPHYGPAGKKIRSVLYHYGNEQLISFFESQSVPVFSREDGKVFPRSLRGPDVLDSLVQACLNGKTRFSFGMPVQNLIPWKNGFTLSCGASDNSATIRAKNVLAATGGCSYPATGSDGSFFSVLKQLEIEPVPPRPALVPLFTGEYPYSGLSGISFPHVGVRLLDQTTQKKLAENADALLFTHQGFSGPVVLNLSRYARQGQILSLCYLPGSDRAALSRLFKEGSRGNQKQLLTFLADCTPLSPLSRRFLEVLCLRSGITPSEKSSAVSGAGFDRLALLLTDDRFPLSGTGGFREAMVTAGGVPLEAVNLKTMESLNYPGFYFSGEVLDVDGDTGGYNLQFAFSSAHLAALGILNRLAGPEK